jgi:hypothetical protein
MKPHTVFITIAWLAVSIGAHSQSLSSFKIGDPSSKLSSLGKPTASDDRNGMTVRRWLLPNGNELAVTTNASGQIIYIEADWNPGANTDSACDLPGLRFGTTTLTELRKRFGSNGFAFSERGGQLLSEDGAVLVNSYEANGAIVTFYNKVSNAQAEQLNPEGNGSIADNAKLDAISIASSDYAKSEWGNRINDPNYKPITWAAPRESSRRYP